LKHRLALVAAAIATFSYSTFSEAEPQAGSWIDVSAPIDPKTAPVYPGNAPVKLDFLMYYDKGDKLALSSYSLGAHTGTHVDAPLHFIKGGTSVDLVSLDHFVGPARLIDCSPDAKVIDAAELNKHDWKGARRILFRTRNSRNHWMTDPTFHEDFTYLAPDAAQLLADAGVDLCGLRCPRVHRVSLQLPAERERHADALVGPIRPPTTPRLSDFAPATCQRQPPWSMRGTSRSVPPNAIHPCWQTAECHL
jgi:kynurenine formamidase